MRLPTIPAAAGGDASLIMSITMPIIELEDGTHIEVDPGFLKMSPRKQQQVIDEIAAQVPKQQPDYAKIRRNVARIIDQGGPESDIEDYLRSENVTAAQLRAHRDAGKPQSSRDVTVTFADGSTHVYKNTPGTVTPEQVTARAEREFGQQVTALDGGRRSGSNPTQSHTGGLTPRASHGGDNPDHIVDSKMATIARSMGVGIDDALSPAQLEAFRDAYVQTEGSKTHNIGNLKNPGGDGFQVFPTEDAGRAAIDAQIRRDFNRGQTTIRSLIEGYPIGSPLTPPSVLSEGDEAPSEEAPVPASGPQAPASGMGIGDLVAGRKTPKADNDFFRMPKDWNEFGHGLAVGAGDVVEGLADVPGIALDPINTVIGRALGYDGYTADFGKTVRETLGLPEDKSLSGDVIRGASGGLGMSATSRLLAKAGTGAISAGLKELGSTPVRDTVGGAGAALGSGLAQEAGAPLPVQIAAGFAGGATSVLGLEKGAERAARFADTRTGARLVPKLAQQRFEARQAMNKYASYDRAISSDLEKLVQNVTGSASAKSKLTRTQKAALVDHVSELEASYLPYDEIKSLSIAASAKARFRKALDNRHLLGDDDIAAIDDGTVAGAATADAIRKARRVRSLIPEIAARPGSNTGRVLAEAIGSTAGYKIAGPLGGAIGSVAGRALSRSRVNAAASRAAEIAADAPKFARMPDEVFNAPGTLAQQALSKLADETRDAPFIASKEAERLADEGRKIGIANDRDNIRPQGGYRGYLYDNIGLLPQDQDAGAMMLLKDGVITPEQLGHFLGSPDKLMEGKAGLHIADRLASMTDDGRLARDPKWSPLEAPAPSAPMVDAQGQPIRSLPAYQGGIAKNVAREADLMRQLDEVDPIRAELAEGPPLRDSDLGALSEADAARAAGIRAELARMKAGKGKAQ